MIFLYNIGIFFSLFFMATSTTKLAPPSLSQVLAQNVAANTSSTTAPSTTTTPKTISYTYTPAEPTYMVTSSAVTDKNGKTTVTWGNAKYTDGYGNTITGTDALNKISSTTGTSFTDQGIYAPWYTWVRNTPVSSINAPTTPPVQTPPRVQIGSYVSSFRDALGKSSTKEDYQKTINYDTLTKQQKKIADRMFDVGEKQGKLKPIDIYDDRQKALDEEKKKTKEYYDTEVARQKKAEEEALAQDKANIDQQTGDITSLRDQYVADEEARLKDTETNRLNQVRWNIMQVLAQRGVDISKLSPEQIVALSGEQGAKAFMDIADARDASKAKIENAKQNALAKLNELRNAKALSEKTYAKNVANINSQAEAAKLSADQNASSQIFAIATTKDQQARQDTTQRVNAVTNMASTLGLSGSQIAPLLKLIDTKWYGPQQVQAIASMLADPNSDISKSVAENMSAAQKAALLKAQIELQDSNAKLITANASMVRANKTGSSSGSSGITVNV